MSMSRFSAVAEAGGSEYGGRAQRCKRELSPGDSSIHDKLHRTNRGVTQRRKSRSAYVLVVANLCNRRRSLAVRSRLSNSKMTSSLSS
jgi:hypothetical protein